MRNFNKAVPLNGLDLAKNERGNLGRRMIWARFNGHALYTMWVMTFTPYLAVALGELALSFLRRSLNYWPRLGLGVLTTSVAYIAFVLVAKSG